MLILTFVLVPGTSTRILKTFLCERFQYSDEPDATRRYLQSDLSMRCDSGQWYDSRRDAIFLSCVWPIGASTAA